MGERRRIVISLPQALVTEIDRLVVEEQCDRSKLVHKALQCYVQQQRRHRLHDQMRQGYQIMAEINLVLAEEGADEGALAQYERVLAEAE